MQLAKFNIFFVLLNKSVPVLIGIFIFFNPFPHTTSIKEICFYLSVFIVLVLVIFKKTEFSFNTPLLLPVGLFVFWAFLSIFFAFDKDNSIHDFYSHLIRYIILYYIITNFFRSKKSLTDLSWIIIISSSIFSATAILYFYHILGNALSTRFAAIGLESGLLTQTPVNIIGVITVFAIILAMHNLITEAHLFPRVILILCLLSLSAAIFLTQTRSTLMAVVLGAIVLFFKNKKIMVVMIGMIFLVIILTPLKNRFSLNNILKNERIGINYITLEIIKDYPITGIGFGLQTYGNLNLNEYNQMMSEKYRSKSIITDPHNMFLDVAVRLGIIGLAFFIYVIFNFFKMCRVCIKQGKDIFIKNWGRCIASACVAFLVIGFFQPIFSHMPEVILCTIFSLITVLWRINRA